MTFGQLSDANLLICREKITSIIGILLQLGKMANEKDLEDNKVFYFLIHSVVSDSLRAHGLEPARLLCPLGFSRQEHWSGLPCPPAGDLPNPGIEPASLTSLALAGGFFTTSATWEAL